MGVVTYCGSISNNAQAAFCGGQTNRSAIWCSALDALGSATHVLSFSFAKAIVHQGVAETHLGLALGERHLGWSSLFVSVKENVEFG